MCHSLGMRSKLDKMLKLISKSNKINCTVGMSHTAKVTVHTHRGKRPLFPLCLSSFLWPPRLQAISLCMSWGRLLGEKPPHSLRESPLASTCKICIIRKYSSPLFSFQGAPIFHAGSASVSHVERSRPAANYADTPLHSLLNRNRWRGVPLSTHFSFGIFWMFSLRY